MTKETLKGKFKPSSTAESRFYRALRKVAQVAGHIIESHVDGVKITNSQEMQRTLDAYSKLIEPWARRQSAKMLEQVQRSNKRAYQNKSKAIGAELKMNFAEKGVGDVALKLMTEQVELIKSIPVEAGLRAQQIAYDAALHGARAEPDQSVIDQLHKELGMSTEVATSRAKLIAITEVARSNAAINQARAQSVGSKQYRWHNSGDGAVRPAHKMYKGKPLQGRIFSWDNPPTLDDGTTINPGEIFRCRCFAEPVFDEE